MSISAFAIPAITAAAASLKTSPLFIGGLWAAWAILLIASMVLIRNSASKFTRASITVMQLLIAVALTNVTGGLNSSAFSGLLLTVAVSSLMCSPWFSLVGAIISAIVLYLLEFQLSAHALTGTYTVSLMAMPFFSLVGFFAAQPEEFQTISVSSINGDSQKLEEAYAIARREVKEREIRERELYDKQRKLYSLMHLFQQLSSVRDPKVIKHNVVRCAKEETNSQIVALMTSSGNGRLKIECSVGLNALTIDLFAEHASQDFFHAIIQEGKIVRLDGTHRAILEQIVCFNQSIKMLLAVPMQDASSNTATGVLVIANKLVGSSYGDDDEDFLRLLASEAAIAISNIHLYAELERSYYEIIQALAQAIEAKDPYTHGHVARVETVAVHMAHELNLPAAQIELIAKAAILHDVGKISVPDSILMKPGSLTPEEFTIMQNHAANARLILKDIHSLPAIVLDMIIHHHERFDGRGYPDGLAGEAIPLGAQIIALADTFDAMTSDRPYRKGFPIEEAVSRMKQASGQQFEPNLLNKFLEVLERDNHLQKLSLHLKQ